MTTCSAVLSVGRRKQQTACLCCSPVASDYTWQLGPGLHQAEGSWEASQPTPRALATALKPPVRGVREALCPLNKIKYCTGKQGIQQFPWSVKGCPGSAAPCQPCEGANAVQRRNLEISNRTPGVLKTGRAVRGLSESVAAELL